MKRLLPLLLIVLLSLCSSAQAALPGLSDVLSVRSLLSPGVWSRVLRIERKDEGATDQKSFYALVFEAASVLWFYSPEEGTQSLSQHVGRTEKDKQEVGRLLRDVVPSLSRWSEEEAPAAPATPGVPPLNACFIQSLAELDARQRRGMHTEQASLFTYYFEHKRRSYGHTVLVYREQGRTWVYDPGPRVTTHATEAELRNPSRLAQRLAGGHVVRGSRQLGLDSYMASESFAQLAPAAKTPASAVARSEDAHPVVAGGGARIPGQGHMSTAQ